MIAFVRGKVQAYGADYVIIDCGMIGFRINFMHPEMLTLNQEVTIYTYQNVREDEISLYGFSSPSEYDLFISLIQVKGIGPKTALTILSRKSVDELIRIIENNDVNGLKALPGIGAKAASQIILDLKGKLVHPDAEKDAKVDSAEFTDAISALKTLGYKQNEINPIMTELRNQQFQTSEEYVRYALQLLIKRKGV